MVIGNVFINVDLSTWGIPFAYTRTSPGDFEVLFGPIVFWYSSEGFDIDLPGRDD